MNKGDTLVRADAGIASFYAEKIRKGLFGITSKVRNHLFIIAVLLLSSSWLLFSQQARAQSGVCDPTVPFFTVDLTGQPAGLYLSPLVSRLDNCCGTTNPDRCIEFEITLDPGTVAINFTIASGAVPSGSMFYQINCGPPIAVGTPVCISGVGPHTLTFCKPGNNPNTYGIFAIPGPSITGEHLASQICSATLIASGYDPSTIVWHDITSGTGAYDAYLSATTGEDTVTVTPQPGFPPYADYEVCGTPIVPFCYNTADWCDTIRVYFYQYVTASINPNPAIFCQSDGGIMLTGQYFDGIGPYTYEWHSGANGSGPIIGTGLTYFATTGGNYSFVVMDSTYPHCPPAVANVVVTAYPDANLSVTPMDPATCFGVSVDMVASGADNYSWSPAIGLSTTTGPNVTAMPPSTTTYTIIGWNNGPLGCADTLYTTFTVLPDPAVGAGPDDTICLGGSTQLDGSGGLIYVWTPSTGLSNPNIADPIASPLVTTTYILNATAMTGQSIVNGNFSQGNVGFSTQYNYQLNLWPEGFYYVGTNPRVNHANWSACGDHTTGNGNMMIVNGAPVSNQIVWCQTVNVVPNTPYAFSTWLTSVHPDNPALLQFSINGILLGAPFRATSTTCQWNQFYTVWNSGANTTAQICIVNQNTIRTGNDFALDDITFSPLCEGSDTVTVYVSDVNLNIAGTNTNCFNGNNGTATVSATGGYPPYSYQWSTGATSQSISGLTAGNYCVTVTDIVACTETACIIITQPAQLTASMSAITNVSCFGGNNGQATVTPIGGIAPYTFLWSNGTGNQNITGLSAGTYTVTVTDNNGCTATASLTITQPALLTAAINSSTNVSCFGGNNGQATATATDGTSPYSFNWSNGALTAINSNLIAGTYTVTVTDNLGCTATSSVIITQPALLVTSIALNNNVSCFSGANGSATASSIGGTAPYSYAWSNGTATAINNNLIAGTYTVTATDALGCTATSSIIIAQPPLLTAAINSSSNVSCFGGNNGTANASGGGGTPNYSYNWSNGQTSAAISGLIAGNYCVTVTDQLGCTATNCVTITEPAQLTGTVSASTNVSCFGGNDGTATASASGGTPLYNYLWSNSATTPSISILIAGTYTVSITDNLGCSVTTSVIITEPPLCTSAITSSTNVNCFGENNGSASVTANGGTPPYTYLWSNTLTTTTINNLIAGTYSVTVTDALGCTSTASIIITQPTLLGASISGSTNVSCFGGNNGTADVVASGGTAPYTYLWSNGGVTTSVSGLTAGTYTVTITDAHGCTATSSVIITQPTLLTATIISSVNVTCFSVADGSATVGAAGGTPPYFYGWSSGGHNAAEAGLDEGSYTVTVTDILGCTATTTVIITQPTLLTSAISASTNVSCFGGNNGAATVTPAGGTPAYAYAWSNGAITPSATNLIAGTYNVTVTDAQGCTTSTSVIITEPTLLTAAISAITNVSCFTGNNGSATVTAGGGTIPYTYLWSNGNNGATANGLAAGSYTVTITDALGCTATTSVIITQPTLLTATITSTTNVSCFGGNNGSSTVTANGGTIPYTYLWSSGGTGSTENNLIAGTYTVTVTDLLGCTATASVVITQPTLLTAIIGSRVNVSCFHGNNGSAAAIAGGGTPAYSYNWSSGGTAAIENGLTAGTYTVTITDALGCTASALVIIAEPTLLTATISATTNVSCFTGNNGSATVTAGGGTSPYTYLWSSGSTGTIANGLIAGTYTVTITDALGCTATTSVTITEPTLLTVAVPTSTNVSCFSGNNGTADAAANGGTAPYTYLWSNGGITASVTGLTAGTYTVTTTDALGCTATASVLITEPPLLTATIASSVNVTCFSVADGSATVVAAGGTPPYLYAWSSGGHNAAEAGLAAGTYTVTVTDILGCTATTSVIITQPTLLTSAISASTNVSCYGGNNGAATVTPAGGTPAYAYAWSNGAITPSSTNLIAGTYTVTITDAQGCTTSTSVIITQPTLLIVTISATTNVSCFTGNNGSATVTAVGGTIPYTYLWSSGGTAATENGLAAGSYTVTITDALGCSAVTSAVITEPTLLTATITSTTNVSCFGGNNGSSTVTANGGTIPYTYLWSSGGTGSTENNLIAGTYTVTVTDQLGCTATASVTITQPTLLTAAIGSSVNVSCLHGNDGSATAVAGGGTPAYSYNWSSGGTAATENGLTAGTYTVTITDALGCTASVSVIITEPTLLTATISATTNVSCFTGNNGSATVTAGGGTSPYTYLWSSGSTGTIANGLIAGTYTVTITDALGCTATTSVTITEPTLLTVAVPTSTNVSCFSGNNGTANAAANGGTAPYTYLWSNGGITASVTGLTAGTYSVTTTDALGCTATVSVLITEPTLLTSAITSTTNVSCFGGNNGSSTVTANGGTIPYTYLWSSGGTGSTENNLIAGTYTVTVTDLLGCTATATVVITQPTLLTAAIGSSVNVSCLNGNDGSATAVAGGGTPAYSYNWSSGGTAATENGLTAGTFTVTITDALGCTASVSVIITQSPLLTATITAITNVSCFTGNNGSATVTAGGGTSPYTYLWSTGGTAATENGLAAGSYTVTVTDNLGCAAATAVTITEPTLLTFAVPTSTNVSCFSGNNGTANSVANGGTTPYTYLWSNGGITASVTGLTAGTYTVTTTDALGCTATASVLITEPPLLTATIASSVNVTCFSVADGSATVVAAGGTPPYLYAWSSGGHNAAEAGLVAGTYTVTVTDILGCTATTSVIITQPTLLTSAISASTNVSCFVGNNGAATVTPAGGTPAYSYAWSNGAITPSTTNLIAGTYTVTVTDAQGCTTSTPVIITEPTLLTATISAITNVSCFTGNNGSSTVTAGGGTIPYTYLWSNGNNSATANGLAAGSFTVTITDALGCTATTSVIITEPTLLTIAVPTSTNVSCFMGNNGTANSVVNGGTAPYTYLWSNGAIAASLSGLTAGTYTVTTTDGLGCTASASVIITEPTLLSATIASSVNVSCFSMSNGSAVSIAAGGTPPYSYLWSSGSNLPAATGLSAGNYTITITDALSCTATESIVITEPALLISAITSSTNVSCFGGSDGSVTANANGGTLAYNYLWSNGAANASANGLSAGTYSVTITDAQGCTTSTSVIITEPTLLTSSITGSINASCFGSNNGSITVTAVGGTLPYGYAWSNGSNSATATGLIAGTYTVTITDNHNCTSTSVATITHPDLLIASIPTAVNIACFGEHTGTVGGNAIGGVSPYQYNWSNGINTSSATNLAAGAYSVTINDANGCTSTATVTLTEPPALKLSVHTTDILCNGNNTGSATATVNGGVSPYTYSWTPTGFHTPTVTNLAAASYTSRVDDAHGCSISEPFDIVEPPLFQVQVSSLTNVSCFSGSDGAATVAATGGVPPYTYLWTALGLTTPSASNLDAGNYSVFISDANHCSMTLNLTIGQPSPVTLNVNNNVDICQGNYTTISASGSGGTAPYGYNWDNGLGSGQNHNIQVWTTTTYHVTITDAMGCTTVPGAVTVNVFPGLQVILNGPTYLCLTNSTTISAAGSGGNGGPYVYTWNNGIGVAGSSITVSPVETTTYIVGISDGCGSPMAWDTLTIVVNDIPNPNFIVDKLYDCEPFTSHFTETTTPPFASYFWDFGDPYSGAANNSTLIDPTHYFANTGHYTITLTVTDSLGCSATIAYQDLIYLYGSPTAAFSWAPTTVTIANPLVEFTNESIDATIYSWKFGDPDTGPLNTSDAENTTHEFSAVGSYEVWLVAENKYGCKDSTMGEIIILDLYTFYAPNAFTPNGDGVNDYFIPQSTNLDYTTFELYLYDRWGELIYFTEDPNAPWDGRAKSSKQIVQQDVYTWFVFVSEMSGRKHQYIGHVTVVK